ncbi:hypothetical protein O6H91_Y454600 [Diphasiastrum complanatum]|nr:hypothetical protein O6H91_Y454600 [Diphasiastrum complanatum]
MQNAKREHMICGASDTRMCSSLSGITKRHVFQGRSTPLCYATPHIYKLCILINSFLINRMCLVRCMVIELSSCPCSIGNFHSFLFLTGLGLNFICDLNCGSVDEGYHALV